MDKLLTENIYRESINERGEGLVHLAATLNDSNLLTCLSTNYFDFNQKTTFGYSTLRMAIINQRLGTISDLVLMKVDEDGRELYKLQTSIDYYHQVRLYSRLY